MQIDRALTYCSKELVFNLRNILIYPQIDFLSLVSSDRDTRVTTQLHNHYYLQDLSIGKIA